MSVLSNTLGSIPNDPARFLDDAERGLSAFAHHFAKLAGEDQLAVPRIARRFDEQDIASDRRPGEAGRDARHARAHRQLAFEPRRSQDGGKISARYSHGPALSFGDADSGISNRLADLALKASNASLPRVMLYDLTQRFIRDFNLPGLNPIRLQLSRHQIAASDVKFFVRSVPGKRDDLHAVAQRTRNGVEDVGRGDEHDPAQVEWRSEVIVTKRVVLLGIKHFQQRRAGIAMDAGAELVYLVEHHHAVACSCLADRLDNVAGQRPDVGSTMAADLRLVVDAAKAHPHEFSVHGARDRLAERGLSDARRPNEAQDRRLAMRRELADGEIFDNPPFDFFEAVMILIQNAARLGDIDRRFFGRFHGSSISQSR